MTTVSVLLVYLFLGVLIKSRERFKVKATVAGGSFNLCVKHFWGERPPLRQTIHKYHDSLGHSSESLKTCTTEDSRFQINGMNVFSYCIRAHLRVLKDKMSISKGQTTCSSIGFRGKVKKAAKHSDTGTGSFTQNFRINGITDLKVLSSSALK